MMKKLFLMACLFSLSAMAMADDVQKISSSKISKITFEGDNMIIHYNDGTADQTAKMSEIVIDFSEATSIDERITLSEKYGLEGKTVYNLKGQVVGESVARLTKGIYIVDGKKIVIK